MIVGILIAGFLLIATALQNTQSELAALLQRDLLGKQGFFLWLAAVVSLGAIGYVPGLERTSRNLILLLLVVVVLRNGGIWANAQAALQGASQAGPAPSAINPAPQQSSSGASSGGSGGGSGGSGSAISNIGSGAATGAAIGGPYGAAAGAAFGALESFL